MCALASLRSIGEVPRPAGAAARYPRSTPRDTVAAMIIGRQAELSALRAARAVVLEGEAGIGKTTLLEAALLDAELPRAALPAGARRRRSSRSPRSPTCSPTCRCPTCPAPQRRALEIALQRREAGRPPPDVRAIAGGRARRAARSSRRVADRRDRRRAVARRAVAHGPGVRAAPRSTAIAVLVARRSAGGERCRSGCRRAEPGSRCGPLEPGALHRAARVAARARAARARRSCALHERSGGNPFYALELALADAAAATIRASSTTACRAAGGRARAGPARRAALRPAARSRARRWPSRERSTRRSRPACSRSTAPVSRSPTRCWRGRRARRSGPERRASLHRELAGRRAQRRGARAAPGAGHVDAGRGGRRRSSKPPPGGRAAAARAETAARLCRARGPARPPSACGAARSSPPPSSHVAAGDPRRAHELLAELIERLPPGPTRAEALRCSAGSAFDDLESAVRSASRRSPRPARTCG